MVFSASGKYCKVLLLPNLAFKGFLDLQPCPAMGADASVRRLFYCPTMPTIHTSGATFWQAVGEVVYALTECPLTLCLGYRAKMLALFQNRFFKFVSWFHRLKNQIVTVVFGVLRFRFSSLVRYGSVSWRVPHVGTA